MLFRSDRIHQNISPEVSLHAVGQGALGIECREGDEEILAILSAIEDPDTNARTVAERSFLRELEGGCQVPIGVNTSIEDNVLTLVGMVASLDGKQLIKDSVSGNRNQSEQLGKDLAVKLREQGAGEILAKIFDEVGRG